MDYDKNLPGPDCPECGSTNINLRSFEGEEWEECAECGAEITDPLDR